MAESEFTKEEIQAGLVELNERFGVYSTIDMLSKHTRLSEDTLLSEWTYYRFWFKISYISHTNAYQRRLSQIYRRWFHFTMNYKAVNDYFKDISQHIGVAAKYFHGRLFDAALTTQDKGLYVH